ncbi:hemerythrin domain-containing protein [Nocardia tengchongensis]|uniref:hemerythrin domain-containing protein n=1 Tax=Nocardia tengchongensis TaxID=2055889 RepID=UPI0036909943
MANPSNPVELAGVDDVIGLLVRQHEQMRVLFTDIAAAVDSVEREVTFFTLRRFLAVHEAAEAQIIHPRARIELDGGSAMVDARLREEHDAGVQLTQLESLDHGSAEFEEKLILLSGFLIAHNAREEEEEFPRLRDELEPRQLQAMRRAGELAATPAPAPARPTMASVGANLFPGPFADMLERARDLISEPSEPSEG